MIEDLPKERCCVDNCVMVSCQIKKKEERSHESRLIMQDYTDYFAMRLSMNVEQLLSGHFGEDTTQVAA